MLWITAGLSCDGDSVSVTAAMQPSIEDIVLGAIPGLPKVHLHNPVLAYEMGDDFMKYWYMAERLLSWLVSACRDTISQIVIVSLIATSIGLARFPHAMVGAGEVLSDIFAGGQTTWGEFGAFIGITTLGNGPGGIVFVALLKYGHSTRGAD